jgi:hypothetical protein
MGFHCPYKKDSYVYKSAILEEYHHAIAQIHGGASISLWQKSPSL